MTHLGDVTKISGYTAPVVDCIIGGSPCQDLSVAGKRAGLAGERSGLFMEQIRITKEMRVRDRADGRTSNMVRPRFLVWENVPGALSSNHGEDFRAVLEEITHVADKSAVVPRLEKWRTSGCILGNGWSIAWRIHDAQFWGVPQRRRRIALVADFGGLAAHEILFVRKGVSGDTAEGEETREGAAGGVDDGVNPAVARSLTARHGVAVLPFDPSQITSPANRSNPQWGDACPTLHAGFDLPMVAVDCRNHNISSVSGTLQAKGNGGQSLNYINPVFADQVVRRLTPLECERLQGYPDGWTDIGAWTDSKGKLHKESSDSARYKALGNSIALPPWKWVLKRICALYERDATMASLFDGIGGFPLLWERINGPGSCLWASEIEEFPMAVTRARFGG